MLALALTALLVAAAAQLALPVALRYLIDEGLAVRDAATINRYFVLFLAAAVVFGVFAALRFYLVTWLGERVVADVRNAVYANVMRMDPTFFEVTRTGEVLSRLTADTTLVQSISGVGISITLRSTLTLLGSLVMLVVHEPDVGFDDRRADAAHRRAVDHARQAVAPLIARLAGPRRRRERARRRNHQRGADRAGVQSRAAADAAFSRRRRALVRGGRAAQQAAGLAHGARDDVRVRRDHVRAVGRRAPGVGRHA